MALSYFCSHCGAENIPGDALCHACQQSLGVSGDGTLEASTLLNERYELLVEVGAGGFGAVYKARDTREHARLVAVKQINLKGLSSQEIIEATDAFNREAEILTSLSHPLLPRIYDRFSDPEHWYLVMNFIDGQTLDDYLEQQVISALPNRRGLSLDETLAIALHLCDALHYLHTQQPPVIFRDLKPGNIMRTTRGNLYLIDFGIARRFKPGQAKDTIPFGSPGFAAPEQYGRAQTTPQADIYSLGALLYYLISGDDPSEHPFQFPPLRLPSTEGLRELEELIAHMVALEPARRPADIRAVRAELQRIQHLHTQASQRSRIWTPPQGQTPQLASSGGQQHLFQTSSSANPPAPKRKPTRRRVLTVGLIAGGAALIGGVALVNRNQGQLSA
ncbi:MAG TPA: serine/threonine-protein kinase, partial [Ktedonobacteraceae bacterium]